MRRRRIMVLKFGSSILRTPADIPRVGHEIYRWVRDGWKVVAVVSAFAGETDSLLAEAGGYDQTEAEVGRALLASTGELRSAAHLALGLDQAGISVELLDSAAIGLDTLGTPLDAAPCRLAVERICGAFRRAAVLVVPGFIGRDSRRRVTLLGRGGSDCTAIFLAQQLRARCRLIKDVAGLYEWDPQAADIPPRRFHSLPWEAALELDGSIVQHKAIAAAQEQRQTFEVGALFARAASRVGQVPLRFATSRARRPRLRVAVLGAGTVGRGVLHRLHNLGEWFEIAGVAVRRPERHTDLPRPWRVTAAAELLQREFDVLVDAAGDARQACAAAQDCLANGRHVVTADKRLVASAGPQLEDLARQTGAHFAFSAAVGGALPAYETVQRLARRQPLTKIEAILNGTTNFVLERCRAGEALSAALAAAQAAGLAEQDASRDLDGLDAADKLVLLARAAVGRWLDPTDIRVEPWGEAQARLATPNPRPGVWRQVATLELAGTAIRGSVEYRWISASSPLAKCPGAWNMVTVHHLDGRQTTLRGKGAGRWPTAESVVGDLLDLTHRHQPRTRPAGPVIALASVPLREEIA